LIGSTVIAAIIGERFEKRPQHDAINDNDTRAETPT
jgi:hypothetical protein